jgi:hypothetical protein
VFHANLIHPEVYFRAKQALANSTGMKPGICGCGHLACKIRRDLMATGASLHHNVKMAVGADRGTPLRFRLTDELATGNEPLQESFHSLQDIPNRYPR